MSGLASSANGTGNGTGKVTLTLWVHDASQAPGTQQAGSNGTSQPSSTRTSYGVPLANSLSSEVVLSPELLKNEILDIDIGDVVELVKASSSAQSGNNGNGNTAINGQGGSAVKDALDHEGLYKQHHRRHRRHSKAETIKILPNPDSLVFRVERSSLANEGSSGQLQVTYFLTQ